MATLRIDTTEIMRARGHTITNQETNTTRILMRFLKGEPLSTRRLGNTKTTAAPHEGDAAAVLIRTLLVAKETGWVMRTNSLRNRSYYLLMDQRRLARATGEGVLSQDQVRQIVRCLLAVPARHPQNLALLAANGEGPVLGLDQRAKDTGKIAVIVGKDELLERRKIKKRMRRSEVS